MAFTLKIFLGFVLFVHAALGYYYFPKSVQDENEIINDQEEEYYDYYDANNVDKSIDIAERSFKRCEENYHHTIVSDMFTITTPAVKCRKDCDRRHCNAKVTTIKKPKRIDKDTFDKIKQQVPGLLEGIHALFVSEDHVYVSRCECY